MLLCIARLDHHTSMCEKWIFFLPIRQRRIFFIENQRVKLMNKMLNIAAYRFVSLKENTLHELRAQLLKEALECDLKGTILLSTEGINLFLSGERELIETYQSFLSKCHEVQ